MSVSRMMRKRCAPRTSTPGKQLAEVLADDVLEKREACGRAGGACGSGTKRGSIGGHLDARELGAPVVRGPTTAKFLLRFEMSGNGMAGIEGQRRQQREDLASGNRRVR